MPFVAVRLQWGQRIFSSSAGVSSADFAVLLAALAVIGQDALRFVTFYKAGAIAAKAKLKD